MREPTDDVLRSYELVAEDYAEQFRDELSRKPFDRRMLDWLVERVGRLGPVCDMGCGPGQVARYLHERGARACGVDLSPAMVAQARRLHPPEIGFAVGDMLALEGVADEAYGGVAAFYSIVNLPPASLGRALRELHRTLRRTGTLLVAFHVGEEVKRLEEWWGKPVRVDFYFYRTDEVKRELSEAGFALEEVIEREPYPPEVEYQSRRAYLFARKP